MTPEEIAALKAEARSIRARLAALKPTVDQIAAYERYISNHTDEKDEFMRLRGRFAQISHLVFDSELT